MKGTYDNKTLQNMEQISKQFHGFYGDYFRGERDDAKLLDMTTQPFWQSMRLSKKRLSDKGLRMDVQFSLDADKEKVRGFARLGTSDKVHLEREEKSLTGRKINWLKTNRK